MTVEYGLDHPLAGSMASAPTLDAQRAAELAHTRQREAFLERISALKESLAAERRTSQDYADRLREANALRQTAEVRAHELAHRCQLAEFRLDEARELWALPYGWEWDAEAEIFLRTVGDLTGAVALEEAATAPSWAETWGWQITTPDPGGDRDAMVASGEAGSPGEAIEVVEDKLVELREVRRG